MGEAGNDNPQVVGNYVWINADSTGNRAAS
jgi:hypothetical protein